jgi:hypothetical protein
VARPPGNRQMGHFSGAQNIKRDFERGLEAKQRRYNDELLGRPVEDRDAAKKPGRSICIRGRYKTQTYYAWLRHVGTVKYHGKVYSSLSAAATAICKHPVNGRWFWHFERSPGDWVRIRDK